MSGGHFDYNQNKIHYIVEDIEEILERQGKEKEIDWFSLWDKVYYENHPEERFHVTYREDIQAKLKEGIMALKIAAIYAQRIDWYLSGDDGENSFLERLKEDLDNLKNNENRNKGDL